MERSLSVLLPVRNVQSTLAASVVEILEVLPELAAHFELVIIDDGSTDATIELADELAAQYPQVRVVSHGEPLGQAAALQSGLQCSSGEIVFLQDAERGLDVDQIDKLRRAVAARDQTISRPSRLASRLDAGVARRGTDDLAPLAPSPRTDSPQSVPGKPKRPNYLTKIRDFAWGE